MITAVRCEPLISPEDFLADESHASERHEFLNGVVYAMAGGTVRHSRIVQNLSGMLYNQLRGKRCESFNSDMMVKVQMGADLRFYYPDASIVCQTAADAARFQESPTVVFEVLSPSTRRTDQTEKWDAYLSLPSLQAYVLIDSEQQAVTVWRRLAAQWNSVYLTNNEAVIELEFAGCLLKVGELYERVVW
jgi:Uma2 family endonuclease